MSDHKNTRWVPLQIAAAFLVDAFHYLALFVIGGSVVWSGVMSYIAIMSKGYARLDDLLLLFIYLELGTIIGIYFKTNKLPVRFLVYIAITALTRYLTVDVKEAGTYTLDILYTSNRGAKISFDLDGKSLTEPFALTTTFNAAETIPWRNWHHWNIAKDAVTVSLPAGKQLLTVHIIENGNMNLAYFDFKKKS